MLAEAWRAERNLYTEVHKNEEQCTHWLAQQLSSLMPQPAWEIPLISAPRARFPVTEICLVYGGKRHQ